MKRPIRQKGISVVLLIVVIAIISISYLFLSSTLFKSKKDNGLLEDNNLKSTANNDFIQAACKNAINDYPEWTKSSSDIVIWENSDKSFNFRNAPEDASTKLDSPVPSTEKLADMDFLGLNEISYATIGSDNWKISILKLNGMNPYVNSFVYEKKENISYVNISPISKTGFIVLSVNGNRGFLKLINTENLKEEILQEITPIITDNLKLSVSPKESYFYLLNNNSLLIFDIASKKQTDKINSVKSAVWIGNEFVFYSNPEGTYIYSLKTKEKSNFSKIGQSTNLSFNPKEGGIIAFNEGGDTKIINCKTGQIINSKQGAVLKTLTSEKTAITQKGDQFGYWRFNGNDWGVNILEEKSKFVTVWQLY